VGKIIIQTLSVICHEFCSVDACSALVLMFIVNVSRVIHVSIYTKSLSTALIIQSSYFQSY